MSGLDCKNPGGCRFPKVPCLAVCSFSMAAIPMDKTPFRQRKQYSLEDMEAAVMADRISWLEWISADGVHRTISRDYAVQIVKWAFDKYGDVDALDAAMST